MISKYTTTYSITALVFIAVIIGYIINIFEIVALDVVTTGEGIIRIVGIFIPPLGAIMGLFVW